MAAATVYSNRYTSSGEPTGGRPFSAPHLEQDQVSYTIATTSLDDAGDVICLLPLPARRRLLYVVLVASPDFDAGGTTLDADLVFRTLDSSGTATYTTVEDSGAAWAGVRTSGTVIYADQIIPAGVKTWTDLCLKVNVAAGTPASGTLKLIAVIR